MSSADDPIPDALNSLAGVDAFQLDSLGFSEMHSPLYHSPMFRLDSNPEPDAPTLGAPPLGALGLGAMPTPQCIASPTSSVDYGVPCLDFLHTSSPGSLWSCSNHVSDRSRRRRCPIKW